MTPVPSTFVKITALTLCGVTLGAFVVKDTDPFAAVKVTKSYQSDDFGPLDLMGACRVTTDTVECWNGDGKPDPDLSEKIKAFYIIERSPELHFVFGRKNRLAVFKRPPSRFGKVTFQTVTGTNSQNINSAGQIGGASSYTDPYLEWYSIDTEPSQITTALTFNLNVSLGTELIPLREGAEGSIGPLKVHIDSIKPGAEKEPRFGLPSHMRTWNIAVSLSGFAGPQPPSLSGRPANEKGEIINRVDLKGNPYSKAQTEKFMRTGYNNSESSDPYLYVREGVGTTHQVLSMLANPSKVASLSLSAGGIRNVTFTDIPLDPK